MLIHWNQSFEMLRYERCSVHLHSSLDLAFALTEIWPHICHVFWVLQEDMGQATTMIMLLQ